MRSVSFNDISLRYYFKFSYLMMFIITSCFSLIADVPTIYVAAFLIAVQTVYSLIYLLPSLLLILLIDNICKVLKIEKKKYNLCRIIISVCMIAITELLVILDFKIFNIFGFHINSFVLNLAITKGGVESMGADRSTYLFLFIILIVLILTQIVFLILSSRKKNEIILSTIISNKKSNIIFTFLLLSCFLFQTFSWGISHLNGDHSIITAATNFPLYQTITIRTLAKKLGYTIKRNEDFNISVSQSSLNYPLRNININHQKKKLNIVWLVSESWRADMLDPEIMPATYKFSQKAHYFKNHYSGGNGTRMGVFTMFYGVYGSYWFRFLNESKSPVLMDILKQQGYQFSMYTSAKFTYPEFDKTVFSEIPKEKLHELDGCGGFVNDRKNVSDLINFIEKRDITIPFMTFMFFESPHAPYTFPDECNIKDDYLNHINYAVVDIKKEIKKIKNRYINSCNHLDSQLQRIFDYLTKKSLLNNTIVIVTGDHGEEFMEKGRWGHNSEFHQEQLKVPLILWVPGRGKGEHLNMTSHLDIPATIAPILGIMNKSEDYTLGYDLLSDHVRKYTICSSWTHIGFINQKFKYSIPLKYSVLLPSLLTTKDDVKLSNKSIFMKENKKDLIQVMKDMGKFYIRN